MNIDNEAIQVLAKEITKMINVIVSKSKFDRTVKGRITDIKGNNKYTVMINGNEYNAVSHISELSVNDMVYITIAQNDYNNLIILAKF